MRLLQTPLDENFKSTIQSWIKTIEDDGVSAFFHVYVPYDSDRIRGEIDKIRKVLSENAPGIPVVGCTATGEISCGEMIDDNLLVTLTIFDDPTTRIEVVPYYAGEKEMDDEHLLQYALSIPDLKGMEVLTAASYQRFDDGRKVIDRLPEEIEVFGGVAVGDEIFPSFVFANDCEISYNSSVIIFYSGPELYLQTDRMFGWKPIGYPFTVTRSKGPVVYELDGKPAYDVYNHYLRIKKDSNFFYNALDFPWEIQVDDETKCLRHAKSVNPDGSIVMSSNIPQGSEVRLTYGDPRRIIAHTKQTGLLIKDFAPQVVKIVNCLGRKIFWGGKETIEIEEISGQMQTTGYSALGEIMRYKGRTLINNLSIVTVAMREGAAKQAIDIDIDKMEKTGDMPITARLAIFINTITDELMEKNRQLNDMLYKASHDAMTGLYNRGAIERIIYEAEDPSKGESKNWYLIMFDIDDFKMINDQCGHLEGDHILKMVAENLDAYVKTLPGVEAGRWGGEEFMLFAEGYSASEVKAMADSLLLKIKENIVSPMPVTISIGATMHHEDEDVLQSISRVDELMYTAKSRGKNQVCSDI